MERTPGNIIAKMRRQFPEKFSLDKLAEIIGMSPKSILRFERGEQAIPERAAEALARSFYKKISEREAFIDFCLESTKLSHRETKERSDRRKARTLVSRDCECRFRIFQMYEHDLQDVIGYSGMYFGINVFRKEDNKKIFTVHTKGFEVWDWGENYQNPEPQRLVREEAILSLLRISREWRGSYALVDLVSKALDEQTSAEHFYGFDENQTVLLSMRSLDYMKDQISKIAVDADERKRKKLAEYLAADIDSLKGWKEDIEESKKELRKQLKKIAVAIEKAHSLTGI